MTQMTHVDALSSFCRPAWSLATFAGIAVLLVVMDAGLVLSCSPRFRS